MGKPDYKKLCARFDAISKERNALVDERDGLRMKLQSLEARTNAQVKRIELLRREAEVAKNKAQAFQEIVWEVLGVDQAAENFNTRLS